MARPRKYPEGQAPTPVERAAEYLTKLREAGGRTRSYNWRPAVVQALDVLKATPEHQFKDETSMISDIIIAAAAAVSTSKDTPAEH